MRIKSAKQAYTLLYSGVVPAGGYEPKAQSSGKNSTSEDLAWELAIVSSPCKHMGELTCYWAEYVYAEGLKAERFFYLKSKICSAVDDYSLNFIENNTVDKHWKMTRLNEYAVEDFRESERRGKRLHTDSYYYLSTGIDRSNYHKFWRGKVDETNTYLDCLNRKALSPVSAKISELKERERLDEAV